jgi:hypothetical protein
MRLSVGDRVDDLHVAAAVLVAVGGVDVLCALRAWLHGLDVRTSAPILEASSQWLFLRHLAGAGPEAPASDDRLGPRSRRPARRGAAAPSSTSASNPQAVGKRGDRHHAGVRSDPLVIEFHLQAIQSDGRVIVTTQVTS